MSISNRMGIPDWARFLKYVVKLENGCWLWVGALRGNGRNVYGAFWVNGKTQRAHIVSYVWTYGEPNCDLHHTCDNSLCVNPEHITPSAAEQPRHRGPSQNFCAHDHEFTPENTYINPRGERQCRICLRAASDRFREKNRDAVNARKRAKRDEERIPQQERPCAHCSRSFTPERSTGEYCDRKDCKSSLRRFYRLRQLGRLDEFDNPFKRRRDN